jgi:hypothetical protein
MTRQAVSQALGRAPGFVSFLESGRRRIKVVEFLTLARVIGFDPFWVLGELEDAIRKAGDAPKSHGSPGLAPASQPLPAPIPGKRSA